MKRILIIGIVLFAALSASATITATPIMVCDQRSSTVTNPQANCTGTIAVGDLVVIFPTCQNCATRTVQSITTSNVTLGTMNGCTNTGSVDKFTNGANAGIHFCWAVVTVGGTNPTFTATFDALSGSFEGLDVLVYRGTVGGWAVDGGPQSCSSTTSATCTPGTSITTSTNAIFVAGFSTDASQPCTAGTGYTLRAITNNVRGCTQSSTSVETAGTTRSGGVTGTSANWIGINIAFKESGAGSPPPCARHMSILGVGCS
jgi:hypothetical protein